LEEAMTAHEETQYAKLLSAKHPRVIKTEAENERALREIEALIAREKVLSQPEIELLELLALLVEKFEDEHYPLPRASPTEILRELMLAHGMTQTQLSKLFPSKGIASEVLSGKRGISKAQAKKLAAHFHVPAALFLGL
jgi:HTH-type transcriptional regulator/antitoxin HigA